jgi:hypothetical protein
MAEETQVERMQHAIYDALRIDEPVGPTTRAILQGQLTDEQRANLEPAPTDRAYDQRQLKSRIYELLVERDGAVAALAAYKAIHKPAQSEGEGEARIEKLIRELRASAEYVESDDYPERMSDDPAHHSYAQGEADAYRDAADRIARAFHPAQSDTPTDQEDTP